MMVVGRRGVNTPREGVGLAGRADSDTGSGQGQTEGSLWTHHTGRKDLLWELWLGLRV